MVKALQCDYVATVFKVELVLAWSVSSFVKMRAWFVFFCVTTCAGVASGIVCPDRWITFRESCYLYGHDMNLTFVEAEHYCRQHGGHLAHVDSLVENAFVKDFARSLRAVHFWLGLSDDTIEGVWQYYDDQTDVKFFDWSPGNPDDYNGVEDCVVFGRDWGFKWNDWPCTMTAEPLCEIRETENTIVG